MTKFKIGKIALLLAAVTLPATMTSCTPGERGAVVGGLIGAGTGAAIGDGTGALIGGGVGALAGSRIAKRRSGYYR